MRALVIKEPGNIQWQEIKEPATPGSDEVLIRLKAAGICGTDVHIYHGTHGAVTYPRIPGHEFSGEVVAVGTEVKDIKVGDRVAVDPVVSCGQCNMCRIGRYNICHSVKCLGVQTEGCFTEVVSIKANRVHPFSPEIDWDTAALVEPFSVAAQIADRLRINREDKVLIVGGGTIGLALFQVVQGVYQAEALISDISQFKLHLAQKMGANVIDAQGVKVVQKAQEIWGNSGPTVIVEAVGNSKLLQELILDAPPGCRVGVIGFTTDPTEIPPVDITKKELEIIGSRMNRDKLPDVLQWFKEGKLIEANKLITHKFKFQEGEKAFQLLNTNPGEVCKIILEF